MCHARSVTRSKRSVAAHLGLALSQHKPQVVTWEIPYPGILYHNKGFSVGTEILEKSVAPEHSRKSVSQVAKVYRARPAPYRVCRPAVWVAAGNSLSQHHPCKPYRDRNGSVLGKLYHDTRRPLSQPKPSLAPNPVVTHRVGLHTRHGLGARSEHAHTTEQGQCLNMVVCVMTWPTAKQDSLGRDRVLLCHDIVWPGREEFRLQQRILYRNRYFRSHVARLGVVPRRGLV